MTNTFAHDPHDAALLTPDLDKLLLQVRGS
jgi:hypothetical protein